MYFYHFKTAKDSVFKDAQRLKLNYFVMYSKSFHNSLNVHYNKFYHNIKNENMKK